MNCILQLQRTDNHLHNLHTQKEMILFIFDSYFVYVKDTYIIKTNLELYHHFTTF